MIPMAAIKASAGRDWGGLAACVVAASKLMHASKAGDYEVGAHPEA